MNCPHCTKDLGSSIVSKERFDEVYEERKQFKVQAESASATGGEAVKWQKIAEANGAKASKLEGDMASLSSTFERQMVLSDAGIKSAEERELVDFRYGKLPTDGRPAFGDFIAQQSDAEKADPILRPFFHREQPKAAGSTNGTPPAKPPPTTGTGTKAPTGPASPLSPEDIARHSQSGTYGDIRDAAYQAAGLPKPAPLRARA
jgi:hypothetical protein